MTKLPQHIIEMVRNPECPLPILLDAIKESFPNSMNVYIVQGETGSYSDHRIWEVSAFLEKEMADTFCRELNDWRRKHKLHEDSEERLSYSEIKKYRDWYEGKDKIISPDPKFDCDGYTGTSYCVVVIPLKLEW